MASTITHASTVDHDRWDGPKRYIRIVVHDTTDELRRAAVRYRGGDWTDAGGGFHPADVVLVEGDDGSLVDASHPHWAGVLRLSREFLTAEVVAHECIHAAAAIYRMDVATVINLGNGCRRREETFAYIAGHVIDLVSSALHEAGAW